MIEKIDPFSNEQRYSSKRFRINFSFKASGKVEGLLTDVLSGKQDSFYGLYVLQQHILKVVFFLDGGNDRSLQAQRCFSGEIFKYEADSYCLLLRWVDFGESSASASNKSYFEILFDQQKKIVDTEIRRIVGDRAKDSAW